MSLFNNPLSYIMNQRVSWLSKRGQVIASNIARADIHSASRRELKPFKDIFRKGSHQGYKGSLSGVSKISDAHIYETRSEISRPTEILEMHHNNLEHEGLINIIRTFYKMVRTVSARSQG